MGFFDDAEINLNDVPDDPFGFGNDFWPLRVVKVEDPKVTKNGDRFGMMVTFAVDHVKFQGSQVSQQLGYGNWFQLPVPKSLQGKVPWDKNSEEGQKVLFSLKQLLAGLGFKADEMGKVGPAEMMHRLTLAKVKPTQNEMGFWQFNVYAFKSVPAGSESGVGEFNSATTSNPGQGSSTEDLLKKELEES